MNLGTVLLIDDETTVLNLLTLMLERLGYVVMIAQSGREGFNLFQVHQKDIRFIISDVNMDPINGWELLQMVREILVNMPFVMTSGYDRLTHTNDYKHQPTSYLTKPYLFKKLSKTIKKIDNKL